MKGNSGKGLGELSLARAISLGDLLLKMGGVGRVLRATLQYEKMHTNARNATKTKTRDEPKDKVHRGRHSGLSEVRKIGPSGPRR